MIKASYIKHIFNYLFFILLFFFINENIAYSSYYSGNLSAAKKRDYMYRANFSTIVDTSKQSLQECFNNPYCVQDIETQSNYIVDTYKEDIVLLNNHITNTVRIIYPTIDYRLGVKGEYPIYSEMRKNNEVIPSNAAQQRQLVINTHLKRFISIEFREIAKAIREDAINKTSLDNLIIEILQQFHDTIITIIQSENLIDTNNPSQLLKKLISTMSSSKDINVSEEPQYETLLISVREIIADFIEGLANQILGEQTPSLIEKYYPPSSNSESENILEKYKKLSIQTILNNLEFQNKQLKATKLNQQDPKKPNKSYKLLASYCSLHSHIYPDPCFVIPFTMKLTENNNLEIADPYLPESFKNNNYKPYYFIKLHPKFLSFMKKNFIEYDLNNIAKILYKIMLNEKEENVFYIGKGAWEFRYSTLNETYRFIFGKVEIEKDIKFVHLYKITELTNSSFPPKALDGKELITNIEDYQHDFREEYMSLDAETQTVQTKLFYQDEIQLFDDSDKQRFNQKLEQPIIDHIVSYLNNMDISDPYLPENFKNNDYKPYYFIKLNQEVLNFIKYQTYATDKKDIAKVLYKIMLNENIENMSYIGDGIWFFSTNTSSFVFRKVEIEKDVKFIYLYKAYLGSKYINPQTLDTQAFIKNTRDYKNYFNEEYTTIDQVTQKVQTKFFSLDSKEWYSDKYKKGSNNTPNFELAFEDSISEHIVSYLTNLEISDPYQPEKFKINGYRPNYFIQLSPEVLNFIKSGRLNKDNLKDLAKILYKIMLNQNIEKISSYIGEKRWYFSIFDADNYDDYKFIFKKVEIEKDVQFIYLFEVSTDDRITSKKPEQDERTSITNLAQYKNSLQKNYTTLNPTIQQSQIKLFYLNENEKPVYLNSLYKTDATKFEETMEDIISKHIVEYLKNSR